MVSTWEMVVNTPDFSPVLPLQPQLCGEPYIGHHHDLSLITESGYRASPDELQVDTPYNISKIILSLG